MGGFAAAGAPLGVSSSKPRSGEEGPKAKMAKDRDIWRSCGGVLAAGSAF